MPVPSHMNLTGDPQMKKALWAAGLLLAATATACGGDAPTDASTADFCKNWLGSPDDETAKDAAERFEEVGTPEDIPDDARHGFEILLDVVGNADEDATEEELTRMTEELSEDDKHDVEALITYVGETCADELEGSIDDLTSDLPTPELPSSS